MKKDAHDLAAAWWRAMQSGAEGGGNRGALARLRRAPGLAALMALPETFDLFRRLGGAGHWELPRVALAAGVLPCLREDRPGESCARLLGPEHADAPETAALSPLRFRRLLLAETPDERLLAFRRMVALAGGALPVADLARALLFWGDPLRQRWTYEYWGAGLPLSPEAQEPA